MDPPMGGHSGIYRTYRREAQSLTVSERGHEPFGIFPLEAQC